MGRPCAPLSVALPQGGLRGRGRRGAWGGPASGILALPTELEGQWDLNFLFRQAPRAGGPGRSRLGWVSAAAVVASKHDSSRFSCPS